MFVWSFLAFCVSAVAFIVHWWKKQKARINAGENYADDSEYKKISLRKKIIGLICLASLVLMVVAMPKMTPEEEAEYALRQEMKQKEKEDKRLAEEKKAQKEAEEKRLAEEKKVQEKTEEKRLDEEKKAQEKAEEKRLAEEKKSNDRKRITIDSLEDVPSEELARQVTDFVNNNPNERNKLIDYVFNVQIVNRNLIKGKDKPWISKNAANLTEKIPRIAGALNEKTIERYRDALVFVATDYSVLRNTTKEYLDNGIITKRVYDKYLEETIPDENDIELYNAKIKIAELNRRFFEVYVEENKPDDIFLDMLGFITGGVSTKLDSAIDFVMGVGGAIVDEVIFDKEENKKIMQSANNALHNICENLWIDMQNHKDEDSIVEYYRSRVLRGCW